MSTKRAARPSRGMCTDGGARTAAAPPRGGADEHLLGLGPPQAAALPGWQCPSCYQNGFTLASISGDLLKFLSSILIQLLGKKSRAGQLERSPPCPAAKAAPLSCGRLAGLWGLTLHLCPVALNTPPHTRSYPLFLCSSSTRKAEGWPEPGLRGPRSHRGPSGTLDPLCETSSMDRAQDGLVVRNPAGGSVQAGFCRGAQLALCVG